MVVCSVAGITLLLAPSGASAASYHLLGPAKQHVSALRQSERSLGLQMLAPKGYFAIQDCLLIDRNDEDVAAFHEKESVRWLEVYEEEYVPAPQV